MSFHAYPRKPRNPSRGRGSPSSRCDMFRGLRRWRARHSSLLPRSVGLGRAFQEATHELLNAGAVEYVEDLIGAHRPPQLVLLVHPRIVLGAMLGIRHIASALFFGRQPQIVH